MYLIARNEFLRSADRDRRLVPLSQAPAVLDAVTRIRSSTPVYQRTEVKEAFARLREQLDPEDHMLLGLRLDRGLSWNDIAQILGGGRPADLARESAALRKRFERLKSKLATLAADLLGDDD
jgi:DNA-directed RNA polymerase specialized sigma24 family protein